MNIGFDVDEDALDSAWVNCKKLEIDSIDFILSDIQTLRIHGGTKLNPSAMTFQIISPPDFDTVVMNPPFGTRNAGIDTLFVETAMQNANVVYSLHKTSTREVIIMLSINKISVFHARNF